jgi:DNA-binding PadR family transcriptional regulator
MPSTRPVSNPLALAVLSSLWERPMYPYEITTTLRERGKEDSIRLNFGSLYSVIKALEKHGLIRATATEREGNRPERIVYAITDAGRRETDEWLRELLSEPTKEYPAIETALSLITMLPPDEALALLRTRVAKLTADIDHREAQGADLTSQRLPELFLVEYWFKLAMLRAERDWLADLADRIETGTIGDLAIWTQMHDLLASGASPEDVTARLTEHFGEGRPTKS